MASKDEIDLKHYQARSEFRYQIRRFFRASEKLLHAAGFKTQQYHLLLAIKGMPDGVACTIGNVAERLQIQHHSTVELVDRLVARGLVKRTKGGDDRRQVLLELTPKGDKAVREIVRQHRDELSETGFALVNALKKALSGVKRQGTAGVKGS